MRSSINVHLHGDTRVTAAQAADGFIEIASDSDVLNIFFGYDDETRIDNIDKLAEALLDIRIQCLHRLASRPDPIDQAKAAADAR